MNYIIVFDHPYTLSSSQNVPHRRSYSAAVAQHTIDYLKKAGHSVDVIDLHQDNFDPVMHAADLAAWRTKASLNPQVDDYFDRLKSADEIIFVFPLWWEVMPAMTKGFIDKVFSKNRIVSKHPKVILPKQPTIQILTVGGTPTLLYRVVYGNPVMKALGRGTFKKIGLKKVRWHHFNPEDETVSKRQRDLEHIEKYLK
ncbi:hypothetical protein FAM21834_00554 [Lentilactobacillus parabuchneri]|jgi:putative NADPH-quinone reductase|uniref:Flavodoxin-like fold domain-containing protein n=4 Tax=Lentilactobacillus parabuchneri TaxID=152331 RepID=A0A1X1FGS6_9LACO|nr:NAD(P)H-dependent oxidoreductase [Lentilactobacillus parabuchneri]APR06828.1 hypothetical protein FAM21731_00615 [Lentilactobacillus parabuchneri]KRM46911.1 flavodoxin-like protein [Lentilactobacillus parabuchneri DSM 5707 = NBRC 107865]KRN78175.1 flavodoxin-like protein [Lentilactobacillus parabuchneri]MBW0222558.1 NAD(P)H-dependent oxidoreductase [Lentilactobacillus parabuchneri]MBW0245854.1 NAD(P)H-dependent oxidoreductase [Lentilactobacillus parabuchneri]